MGGEGRLVSGEVWLFDRPFGVFYLARRTALLVRFTAGREGGPGGAEISDVVQPSRVRGQSARDWKDAWKNRLCMRCGP